MPAIVILMRLIAITKLCERGKIYIPILILYAKGWNLHFSVFSTWRNDVTKYLRINVCIIGITLQRKLRPCYYTKSRTLLRIFNDNNYLKGYTERIYVYVAILLHAREVFFSFLIKSFVLVNIQRAFTSALRDFCNARVFKYLKLLFLGKKPFFRFYVNLR